MKFSGKVWSDHGTTWLHFGPIRVNHAMPITRKRLDRFAWMHHCFCVDRLLWGSTVGHPNNSWASCWHLMSISRGRLYQWSARAKLNLKIAAKWLFMFVMITMMLHGFACDMCVYFADIFHFTQEVQPSQFSARLSSWHYASIVVVWCKVCSRWVLLDTKPSLVCWYHTFGYFIRCKENLEDYTMFLTIRCCTLLVLYSLTHSCTWPAEGRCNVHFKLPRLADWETPMGKLLDDLWRLPVCNRRDTSEGLNRQMWGLFCMEL